MNLKFFTKYIPEIIYGGNDGIVTTFAIVASFVGSSSENVFVGSGLVVLVFGLANLFGDATSMGLGNFLSERAEIDEVAKKLRHIETGIKHNTLKFQNRTIQILKSQNMDDSEINKLVSIFRSNNQLWISFIASFEYNLPNIQSNKPAKKGMITFLSFVFFGSIPLMPFIFLGDSIESRIASFSSSFLALFLLGIVRWQSSGGNFYSKVFEVVIIGGIAALVAFAIGLLFR